ncbi:hypothetical protein J7M00_04980 [bacterium]|nr:hypothetical protein [bacterium]
MFTLKFNFLILAIFLSVIVCFASGDEISQPGGTVDIDKLNEYLRLHGAKWTATENKFSAMTPEERRHRLGLILPERPLPFSRMMREEKSSLAFPSHFDWRDVNGNDFTTPIRSQGDCGSCWAFAVIGVAEAMINVAENDPDIDVNLSEQYLVSSCCPYGDCDGGYTYYTFEFLQSTGVPDEGCYPYEASNSPCSDRCSDWYGHLRSFGAPFWLPSGASVNTIKSALEDGPVVMCMEVFTDFFYYFGGIYEHIWGSFEGWHAVALVGWDDDDSCWICKNSWGTWWGEGGWFRIKWWQCSTHDWISGIEYIPLSVDVGTDTTIFLDTPAILSASAFGGSPDLSDTDGYYAVWHPGTYVEDSTSMNTVAHPIRLTTYSAEISDLNTTKWDFKQINVVVPISVSSEYGAPYPTDDEILTVGEPVECYVDSLIEIGPDRYAHCCGFNVSGPDSMCGDSSRFTLTPTGYDTIVWLWEEILSVKNASVSDNLYLKISPNPCNPMAKINLYIPQASDVSISVKSITGRTIAKILDTHLPAGEYEYYWDGVDLYGKDAPAGTYFAVIYVNGKRIMGKITLVK